MQAVDFPFLVRLESHFKVCTKIQKASHIHTMRTVRPRSEQQSKGGKKKKEWFKGRKLTR